MAGDRLIKALQYQSFHDKLYILVPELRQHFNDVQILELTHVIALENLRGRFNLAPGGSASGFSEGMVCACTLVLAERAGISG